jgi:ABC-type transport system substrate-binding protein
MPCLTICYPGAAAMHTLVIGSLVLVLYLLGQGPSRVGEQPPAPRGERRIVAKSPLNWRWIALNVFEPLVELDKDGPLVPGLATGWRWLADRTLDVTLRQGGPFHNGEVFDAEIGKLNWDEPQRLAQPCRGGHFMNVKPGARRESLAPSHVRFLFAEPDGGAMAKLTRMPLGNRQCYGELGWGEKSWCIIEGAGPWGTGPYQLVAGFSMPDKRADRVILAANTD